jgi:hypothetical protein
MNKRKPVVALVGPTSVGKTATAIELALTFEGKSSQPIHGISTAAWISVRTSRRWRNVGGFPIISSTFSIRATTTRWPVPT